MSILIRAILFILPFVAFYFLMRYLKARKRADAEEEAQLEGNIGNLALAGIALLAAVLGFIAYSNQGNRDVQYIPPQEIDGEIKPGHIEEKDDEPTDNS